MTTSEFTRLLGQARAVLDRYLFDGEVMRDDVAEICARIDDVLAATAQSNSPKAVQGIERAA